MEESIKNAPFAQFIINDYLADFDLKNEEKLAVVCSSIDELRMAMDCFKLSSSVIAKY